jgi:DNA-directed RNA polymerase subunit RPC12/RpoP
VQILCGQCRQKLRIDDDKAGRKIRCPHCGHKLRAPTFGAAPLPPMEDRREEAEVYYADQARKAMEKSHKVSVTCAKCGKHLRIGARLAGQTARCAACKGTVRIPFPDDMEDFQFPSLKEDVVIEAVAEPEPLDILEGEEEPQALEELAAIVVSRRRRIRRRRVLTWVFPLLTVLFAAAIIAVPFVVHFYFTGTTTEEEQTAGTHQGGTATHPALTRPVVPSPTTGIAVAPPKVGQPHLRVLSAWRDVFAGGGYYPAPLGRTYWKVSVEMLVPRALSLPSTEPRLTLPGPIEVQALGTLASGPSLVKAEAKPLTLIPGEPRVAMFLFDVPESAVEGRLTVADIGAETVRVRPPRPSGDLAGTYSEVPPRNLQPMLRDPIMAAVQSAPDHQLIVKPDGEGGFAVSIPAAHVSGTAQQGSDGTFDLVLTLGNHKPLDARLRPVEGGRVILYLSGEPFHQITYARTGS